MGQGLHSKMLAICARLGRKIWRGTIHMPRSHPSSARPLEHADRIRFTIGFRRPVQSRNDLRLEVLLSDGRWVIFARRVTVAHLSSEARQASAKATLHSGEIFKLGGDCPIAGGDGLSGSGGASQAQMRRGCRS